MNRLPLDRAKSSAQRYLDARQGFEHYRSFAVRSFKSHDVKRTVAFGGLSITAMAATAFRGADFIGATAGVPEVMEAYPDSCPNAQNLLSYTDLARSMVEPPTAQ